MEKSKKFLLVVNTTENIFNINSGGALRSNLFIKALSDIGQVNIICFSKNELVSNIPNCKVIYSQLIPDIKDFWEVFRTLLGMTIRPSNPYIKQAKGINCQSFCQSNGL